MLTHGRKAGRMTRTQTSQVVSAYGGSGRKVEINNYQDAVGGPGDGRDLDAGALASEHIDSRMTSVVEPFTQASHKATDLHQVL